MSARRRQRTRPKPARMRKPRAEDQSTWEAPTTATLRADLRNTADTDAADRLAKGLRGEHE